VKRLMKLAVLLAAVAGPAAAGTVPGQEVPTTVPGQNAPASNPVNDTARAREYFTDTEVVDQNGRKLKFYSDVLQGKTVLISLFYTTCTDACPLVNATLAEVGDILGARLGRDIALVSLSAMPETDTESVLPAYAARFHAGPGRLFLTGAPESVKTLLAKLGQMGPPESHTSMLVLGNVDSGVWTRMAPNTPPPLIAAKLELLADGKFGAEGG